MNCKKCGAEVTGAFCPNCGTAVEKAPEGPAPVEVCLEETPKSAFCTKCGQKIENGASFCPNCGANLRYDPGETRKKPAQNAQQVAGDAALQQTRFIISIVTMIFSFFIIFQSCAAGIYNALESNNQSSGTAGVFLCICWWVAGVVNVAKRASRQYAKIAAVAYLIAGLIGLLLAGGFSDLMIYGFASLVFAVICWLGANPEQLEKIKKG